MTITVRTFAIPAMYPLIMLVAVLSGAALLRLSQRSLDMIWEDKLAIGIGAFCGAMIGAKLPFALFGDAEFWTAAAWLSNGKTILAGLVGGYAGVEFVKWVLGIRTKTGDSFAAPVALSVAIGRLGCFYAGCCFGTPTNLPWGVVYPAVDTVPRHPTQIYESLFHLIMAVALLVLQRHGMFRGQLFKLYIITYAMYRLVTEQIRPEPEMWGQLTAYQWASLGIIAVFSYLWWRDNKQLANIQPVSG
ncbi:prolipoprotein diacylglyceryl transferase [Aeoliella sp. ICT_H6.2]|uniref:Prolipoprotein diacylglyceryl transferase n=1 Tax=Aeoliella straminimaris TaxID=2954799 RepID=A0A9X2FEL3_9BACT|nr:prolipoprotein diacylglyceryl transferase family protein [Aeoliella straminimaris]MCO6046788.1 prolipoprotein diacylglyceryl transferase [Aeoliella straminimaris]